MPTGYTSDLYEGRDISFAEFAGKCAKAFGAYITERENTVTSELTEVSASDYHDKEEFKARERLRTVRGWSEQEAAEQAAVAFTKETQALAEWAERDKRLSKAYRGMLDQVHQWQPPTADHIELKKFMVEQLQSSIEFDTGHTTFRPGPVLKSPKLYRAEEIAKAAKSIEYHVTEGEKERARTAGRNAWIIQLRESLEAFKPED